MKILCPAKINLFLEVTARRPDGYHRLATLFAKIHLYDVLEISANTSGRIELEVERESAGPELLAGDDNLVLRAARGFFRAFRIGQGVRLRLVKRIPLGAGLGGGSSDAAGTLLGLAKVFSLEMNQRRRAILRRLGAGLGADVPFFLHPAGFCLGTGIGERLKPIRVPRSLPYMILVYPAVAVSTAEAYRALPKPSRSDVLTRLSHLDKLIAALRKGRPLAEWGGLLFNRLEEAELPILAQVAQARAILERLGAKPVRMTGSGSSVFGFVSSHGEGEECLRRLRGYPWKVFLTSCNG